MKHVRLFLLMAAVLLCNARAKSYDFVVDGIYYNITDTVALTVEVTYENTSYNSYSGKVVIPNVVINGDVSYSVTSIGDYAFYKSSLLTSVELPLSLSRIGTYAFGSSGLLSFIIPESIVSIDKFAFNR